MNRIRMGIICFKNFFYITFLRYIGKDIKGSRKQLFEKGTNIIIEKRGSIFLGNMISSRCGVIIKAVKGKVEIGDNVFFNYRCGVFSHENIKIGDRCTFGSNVQIYDHDHNYKGSSEDEMFKTSGIVIGNNTWVGANVIILRGTQIGENCVIGANVLVKGIIPDNSLVVEKKDLIITSIKH